jgi:hypothetical protein
MPDDERARPGEEAATGRLDISTLRTLARRAESHPLVDEWTFDPSSVSPRLLRLRLAPNAYPSDVTAARIDIRWFSTGDCSFHPPVRRGRRAREPSGATHDHIYCCLNVNQGYFK